MLRAISSYMSKEYEKYRKDIQYYKKKNNPGHSNWL